MAKAANRSRSSPRSSRSSRSSGSSRSSRNSGSGKRSSSAKRGARATRKIAKKSTKKTREAGAARRGRKSAGRSRQGMRAARGSRPSGGRVSKSLKYSKWIESPGEHEDRPGQSLATRSHEVIRQWAEERQAVPAAVEGTEHDGRPGVLRLNFPGYGGQNLKEVDWEEWFATFDQRGLVFIFQEHKSDGATSNFFRLDNPEREDG
jgi:hypothetical protein